MVNIKSLISISAILMLGLSKSSSSKISYTPVQDTLTSRAKSIYSKNHLLGISFTKRAWQLATLNHSSLDEIKSLNLLAQFYWTDRDYDTAKFYARHSLLLAENQHIDSLQGNAWMLMGLIDYSQGFYSDAIKKYNQSITFYKKEAKLSSIAKGYLNLGICFKRLSQYDEATKCYLLAGSYFENLRDDKDLANTYNSVALLFVVLGDYPKAIDYNKNALSLREKLHDDQLIAESFNNVGVVFKQYHQLDSAISYFSRSVEIHKKDKDSSQLVAPLQNLSAAWREKGNFSKSVYFIRRSLSIAAKYNMKQEFAQGNLNLGKLDISEKKYNEALIAIHISEQAARELKTPDLLMDAYDVEYSLFVQQGDYKEALFYSNKRSVIKDSLFTVAKNKTINELEIKYQTTQKEKDIVALNVENKLEQKVVGQQKRSIVLLTAAAVLLLVFFVIAYRNYLQKTKATKKIQLLNAELNHRVKNNLQILSGLFAMQIDNMTDENTKNALRENSTRLASMNLIHNKLYLDHSTTQIEMQDYLTKLLEEIKDSFGGERNIRLRLEVEELMVEADKAVAIGLIINELATNSFKYAFDDKGGEIYLGLKKTGKSRLLLSLSDTGRGIPAVHKSINNAHKENDSSFGLKLVNLMARQLNSALVVKSEKGVSYQMEIGI